MGRCHRAGSARPVRHGGWGVGCAVAQSIAQGHVGTIEVRSDAGGSVLSVCLPREPDAVAPLN